MTARTVLLIVSLFVPAAVASAEDQPANAVTTGAGSATLFTQDAGKRHYANLFVASPAGRQQRPGLQVREAPQEQPKPKVICGMPTIPVDAGIDPRFRVSSRGADNVTHTIRAMKPPMCTPEQQ